MQIHVYAISRLTRIIPPLSCSTTMQGPSHEKATRVHPEASFATAPAPFATTRHGPKWCFLMHPLIRPTLATLHSRRCQPDTTTRRPPATQGHVGLHNSPPCPSQMHRMHQFAQIVGRSCCRSVTIPGPEKAKLQNKLHAALTAAREFRARPRAAGTARADSLPDCNSSIREHWGSCSSPRTS